MLKFCGALEKLSGKRFLVEIAWKIFVKTFFFFFFWDRLKNFCEDLFFFFFLRSPEKFLWRPFFFFFLESTCALCPWSLALASSIPVLGLESVCPRKGCPWPWPWPRIFFVSLALASSLVSSTPPLLYRLAEITEFSFSKTTFWQIMVLFLILTSARYRHTFGDWETYSLPYQVYLYTSYFRSFTVTVHSLQYYGKYRTRLTLPVAATRYIAILRTKLAND